MAERRPRNQKKRPPVADQPTFADLLLEMPQVEEFERLPVKPRDVTFD